MTAANPPTIWTDCRCLQDRQYRVRGIGRHSASLLRSRRLTEARRFRVVGLIDPDMPALPDEFRDLCDDVSASWNPSLPLQGGVFLSLSPMTHDPRSILRMLGSTRLLTAAIVYDFIPLDWPGYLNSIADRIGYVSHLAALKRFNLFLPISNYTGVCMRELVGAESSRMNVTGVAIRNSFSGSKARVQGPALGKRDRRGEPPYFFIVGGDDPRKNLAVAVRAASRLNLTMPVPVRLRIAGLEGGHGGEACREALRRAAGTDGGIGWLEFVPEVSDGELADLYAGASATIVPSHIEGFSLPVVEAAGCGSPVIASSCAAHLELIRQPEALFASSDVGELADRLERILSEPALGEALRKGQSKIPGDFTEEKVGSRCWDFLCERFQKRFAESVGSHAGRRLKPRISFLSPYPPEHSGVARFTQLTLEAATSRFDVDLFTNAPRPILCPEGVTDAGHISALGMWGRNYDSVVSVVGNSPDHHSAILDLFESYGGPCILHDSRLTHIYFHRLGEERFLRHAGELLGRRVTREEVDLWLQDRDLPSLFVEPVIRRASPLIVHTRKYQEVLRERYGVEAEVATSPPNIHFSPESLCESPRRAARARLGLRDGQFVVCSFGFPHQNKGSSICVMALALLRQWRIPAELHFVGNAAGSDGALLALAKEYGVENFVHAASRFVDEDRYRDFLLAADAAIQLRTYGYGQLSAALTDCIGAAMPVVATSNLADSVESPSYVERVPDHLSPLLAAERLAGMYETTGGRGRTPFLDERNQYCERHSFAYYAQRLEEILGLG